VTTKQEPTRRSLASFHHGTAGAATIAGLSVAQFFAVLAVRETVAVVRRAALRTDTAVPAS
jgi:hypothetical protein